MSADIGVCRRCGHYSRNQRENDTGICRIPNGSSKDGSENKPRQVKVFDISNGKDIRFVTLRVLLCEFETVESFMYLGINIHNNNRTEETASCLSTGNQDSYRE